MMKSIREIIDHNHRHVENIDKEIERILLLEPSRNITAEDHDKWIAGWKKDRGIARDTISYFETLERLQTELAGTN